MRGRQVLDKFNCAGCHQIRPGVYQLKTNKEVVERLEKSFNRAVGNTDSDKSMKGLKNDHFFANHNAWVGSPSPFTDRLQVYGVAPRFAEDKDANPESRDKVLLNVRLVDALRFTNNEKIVRDIPASETIVIAERDLISRTDPWGGRFVHLMVGPRDPDSDKLFTGYLAKQFKGDGDVTMSHLPPPLIREGERVQTKWLYQFVQNPTPIRPEEYMTLRMPRFNMSPEEAQAIVNYFAAAAKVDNPGIGLTYPYEGVPPQRDPRYWAARTKEYVKENSSNEAVEGRVKAELKYAQTALDGLKKAEKKDDKAIAALEAQIKTYNEEIDNKKWDDVRKRWLTPDVYRQDALKLVTNRTLCVTCHNVGDTKIEGAKGPPLDLAAERLRPEWTLEWISNPKRMFAYDTIMTQNFPNDKRDDKGISGQFQESLYGTPREQARAATDALMDLAELRRKVGVPK